MALTCSEADLEAWRKALTAADLDVRTVRHRINMALVHLEVAGAPRFVQEALLAVRHLLGPVNDRGMVDLFAALEAHARGTD